jgi:signal peptidase II
MKIRSHKLIYLLIITSLILIDYFSKSQISAFLKTQAGMIFDVTSFFGLVFSWNYGISFGLFSEYQQYANIAFIVINLLIVSYLIYLLCNSTNRLENYGYVFVIGGACGNILDRMINGAVFDFLYFYYEKYHFPIFNAADMFISFGIAILIFDVCFVQKKS